MKYKREDHFKRISWVASELKPIKSSGWKSKEYGLFKSENISIDNLERVAGVLQLKGCKREDKFKRVAS